MRKKSNMRILWIVNSAIGILSEKLYGKVSNGVWMDALLKDFEKHLSVQLVVVTTAAIKKTVKTTDKGVTFYALPDAPPLLYDENKQSNIAAWKNLIENEKPDLIQIWGTEFTHGLCALRIADKLGIPSVIYMQGYLRSIARYYFAGIPYSELRKSITFRDLLKRDSVIQQQKRYEKNAQKEKEMLQLAANIISENEWCDKSVQAIIPDIRLYHCPLSINSVFADHQWNPDCVEPYSIMCTASGYPLKGLHMVLRAVHQLKDKYPDVKLYVPGTPQVSNGSVQWMLRKRGYTKYIECLIRELGLKENVIWLGQLSQNQLAECYEKANVFVLSSSIENHSSSLKEAMIVGVPCVAAAVGGIPEYVKHGENGFLYRFEEYDVMAQYVKELFENIDLAKRISEDSKKSIRELHMNIDMYEKIMSIYMQILEKTK